jgi:hypothetical protein
MTAAVLALLLGSPAGAMRFSSATVSDPQSLVRGVLAKAPSDRSLPVFPESLTYEVTWGLVSVGEATMGVKEIVDFSGRPAYHIVSRATSNAFCDSFYMVRDLNESWLDAEKLVSLGYSKRLREGRYFRDEWALYDHSAGRFLAKTTRPDETFSFKAGTVPVTVQDILSSLYYVRSQDLKPGTEFTLDVNTKENWPLVVRVVRRQKIATAAGVFSTVLVEPAIREEGIFIQKGRRLQVWLSDDQRKIPVLMRVEVFFGHVTASLLKIGD